MSESVSIVEMKLPKEFVNKTICGDAIEVMKKIPTGSIGLVITSPPYNLKNSTGNSIKDGSGGMGRCGTCERIFSPPRNMPYDEYAE